MIEGLRGEDGVKNLMRRHERGRVRRPVFRADAIGGEPGFLKGTVCLQAGVREYLREPFSKGCLRDSHRRDKSEGSIYIPCC